MLIWDNDGCSRAEGTYITEEIPFPSLRGFELDMHAEVHYTYGLPQRCLIHARSEVLDELSTDVRNRVWGIALDRCLCYDDVEINGSGELINANRGVTLPRH